MKGSNREGMGHWCPLAEFLGKKKKKRKLFCPLVLGKQKAPKAMRWLLGVKKRGWEPGQPKS